MKNKSILIVCSFIIILFLETIKLLAHDFIKSNHTNNTYDRINALNYMRKYVIVPNTEYIDFTDYGGDCTNFVSQILRAGNMNFLGSDRNSMSSWFYRGSYPNYSSTWTDAHIFRKHWANVNNIGYERAYMFRLFTVNSFINNFESIRQSIGLGDIIQHVHKDTGDTYHSQIVSKIGIAYPNKWFYDIKVSQHTPNILDRSLYDMLIDKQNKNLGEDFVCVINIKKSIN